MSKLLSSGCRQLVGSTIGTKGKIIPQQIVKCPCSNIYTAPNFYLVEQSHKFTCFKSYTPQRHLYSRQYLKIDYIGKPELKAGSMHEESIDSYIERLQKYLHELADPKVIVVEDVAKLINNATNERHLDFIEEVISVMKETKNGLGPAVMRLFHKMQQIDRAYIAMKSVDKYGNFYQYNTCYCIVMTMLFRAGRYDDLIELFNLARERLDKGALVVQNSSLTVLAFGAHAKINTPESFQEAKKLFKECNFDGYNPYLQGRIVSFLAYLVIRNGRPALAHNLLSAPIFRYNMIGMQLKTLALIEMQRYEDILDHLRGAISIVGRQTDFLVKEVYDIVVEKVAAITDENMRTEMNEMLYELKSNGLISDKSLDSLVFADILNYEYIRDRQYQANPRYYNENSRYSVRNRSRANQSNVTLLDESTSHYSTANNNLRSVSHKHFNDILFDDLGDDKKLG